MKKLFIVLFIALAALSFAVVATPTELDLHNWVTISPVDLSAATICHVYYPEDGKIGLMLEIQASPTPATITILAGDYGGAAQGDLVLKIDTTAAMMKWLGPVESYRFLQNTGYIDILIEGTFLILKLYPFRFE